nr:synaptogyrin-3-like [Oncorhynchus nerka]
MLLSLQIFSIVVFATITGEGYVNPSLLPDTKCMFNRNDSACGFGVGIGILAFLACVVFIILDAYFPQISNAKERKNIVTVDLVFSGVWTLFWFICFCVLTNQWSHTTEVAGIPVDAARAVVAFSFFSIVTWVSQSFSLSLSLFCLSTVMLLFETASCSWSERSTVNALTR